MSSMRHWELGVLVDEPKTIKMTRSLSEEEYNKYAEAIINVRLLGNRFAIKLVERNHIEYRNLRRFTGILIAMGSGPFR